jgi:hypothetical protein
MGLFDKVREAIVKASDRIDGTTPIAPHEWSPDQAMAVLVEAEHRPGSSPTTSSDGGGLVDVALDAATGIPYRFVLDLRRPGFESYRLEQWVRIPSKVERTWTQGSVQVRAGSEVPLTVTGPGAEDVELTRADMVLQGSLTREAFERESEMAIRMGFLLPADYQEALAKLGG